MRASRPEITAPSRRETWRALGVLLVSLALCGDAIAAPASTEPAKTPAKPAATAPATVKPAAAAPAKTPATAPAKTAAATSAKTPATAPSKTTVAKSGKASVSAPSQPSASMASTQPSSVTPAKTAPKMSTLPNSPSLEQQVTYQYNALGRRDPFMAMAGGNFIGDDVGGNAPPDVGGIKIVGIVWGASDKFALVEDASGSSRVLRAGDPVMNGVVETLKRDAMVVKLTLDGQTEKVEIPLTRKGDQNNANR